jgi:hypothetical protein
MIPCNSLYTRSPLNRSYVAKELGLGVHEFSEKLHILKRVVGMRGDVWICLDDGEVYDPQTQESIGNLYYA